MTNIHQPDAGKMPADRKSQDRAPEQVDQDDDTLPKGLQGMPGPRGALNQQDQRGTGGKPHAAAEQGVGGGKPGQSDVDPNSTDGEDENEEDDDGDDEDEDEETESDKT